MRGYATEKYFLLKKCVHWYIHGGVPKLFCIEEISALECTPRIAAICELLVTLCSKRFRFSMFLPREKWGESQKTKEEVRGVEGRKRCMINGSLFLR